jgi:hypothetical protein
MNPAYLPFWLQRNFTKIAALLLVIFLFFQARVPGISASEAVHLGSRFHFASYAFPVNSAVKAKTVRGSLRWAQRLLFPILMAMVCPTMYAWLIHGQIR